MSYNACMPRVVDHYKVLGVSRDAGIEEVKLAYRKAALSCHPDNYDGDPAEGERKLRALIEAYKAIVRELEPAAWTTVSTEGRTFTPQDFAREGYAASWQPTLEARKRSASASTASSTRPTAPEKHERNETRIFVTFWILAIVLGILVGGAAACYRAWTVGTEQLSTGDLLLSVILGELIYVGLAVATIVLIIVTRQVVRFTLRLAHQGWRFLPGRSRNYDLPQSPSGQELPAGESDEKGA